MDESRAFICRCYTSKLLGNGTLTPACFIISADCLDNAAMAARCIRDILDWVYIASTASLIGSEHIEAIIATVRKRCLLLSLEQGCDLFADMGVPVMCDDQTPRSDVLSVPFTAIVGFDPDKIDLVTPRIPNRW